MPPSAQERRQMQAADHAAGDEEGERDQHAAGAAADGVERAGAAAVGELHADAEHEGADDERRPDRRDGAAEARHQRRDRNDRRRRDGDQQQAAEEAVGLAAHDQAPPRGGEAELGLEEHRAEREAEHQQRRRGRLAVDQHERDQHARAPAPTAIRNGQSRRGARAATAGSVAAMLMAVSRRVLRRSAAAYEPRPSVFLRSSKPRARRSRPDGAGRRSIRPSSRRTAARPAGRAPPTARTSRSPPNGRCCNRLTTGPAGSDAAIVASCVLRPQPVGRRIVEASRCRD